MISSARIKATAATTDTMAIVPLSCRVSDAFFFCRLDSCSVLKTAVESTEDVAVVVASRSVTISILFYSTETAAISTMGFPL